MTVLQDKVCVITGGGGSIGVATARLFLSEGPRCALVDRDESSCRGGRRPCASRHVSVAADVTRTADVRRVVRSIVERWGRIDVLFSNAGDFGGVAHD